MLDFLKDIKGNPKGLGFVQMFKLPFTDQENNQMIMFLPIYFNNDGKGVTVVTG